MELKASHKIGELSDAERAAVDLKAAGAKARDIMDATGLNHSQVERAILKATLTVADCERFVALGTDLGSRAVAGRATELSWGVMGILAGVPESAVRRAFTEASALKSQGLRIGKGGRFYYGDRGQPLYQDTLKPTGTEIAKTAAFPEAIQSAFTQRMVKLNAEGLARMGAQYGLERKKGEKATTFVNRILAAAAELSTKNTEREAELAEVTAEEVA